MECQHEMAVAATSFRAHACWRAWRGQVSEVRDGAKFEALLAWSLVSFVTLE